ncbi:hypothetical protein HPB48_021966 [Haemaphysalis longicornis]|uniref:SWIM-type domain-containing protein n=1 Tax=Haemaphysalis longicornis TaxID=44386 RepID=A0A9J6GB91_HAELO|nr:hypothetical protein HPB48_021966 [Haemaphysalis longicornis]
MDKDFNEMNILSELLPSCKILLCTWHVLKYLQMKVRQSCSNTLDKDKVNKIIKSLVFARDIADYDKKMVDLKKELQHDDGLMQYYLKNWHGCRNMWVHAYRADLFSFGNNTNNNRMESHNQKLKQFMHLHMHLLNAVKALIKYVNDDMLSFSYSQFLERKVSIDTAKMDSFHLEVSAICTEYAGKVIYKEFEMYQKNPGKCSMSGGQHVVSGLKNLHTVSLSTTTCTCIFHNQYRLPCRHIFAVRFKLKKKAFFSCVQERVAKIWLFTNFCTKATECGEKSDS